MNENYALTHLYHPGTGAKVSIPLDLAAELTPAHAQTLIHSVDNLLAAGFTVNAPGLEDGESLYQVGFVVRRETSNDDGTNTPVVDLYPAGQNFRILGKYLNTDTEIAEFEQACGVHLSLLPLYDGNPIERGKKPQLDKFVMALKSPAKVVFKQNPKYEGPEDKKHPKRLFVRWEGLRPADGQTAPILPAMTYERARVITTPAGLEFGSLDAEKLNLIANSRAANVTDTMKKAANIILTEMKQEGA